VADGDWAINAVIKGKGINENTPDVKRFLDSARFAN